MNIINANTNVVNNGGLEDARLKVLHGLSTDTLFLIFSTLHDKNDWKNCMQVCKKWKGCFENRALEWNWKRLYPGQFYPHLSALERFQMEYHIKRANGITNQQDRFLRFTPSRPVIMDSMCFYRDGETLVQLDLLHEQEEEVYRYPFSEVEGKFAVGQNLLLFYRPQKELEVWDTTKFTCIWKGPVVSETAVDLKVNERWVQITSYDSNANKSKFTFYPLGEGVSYSHTVTGKYSGDWLIGDRHIVHKNKTKTPIQGILNIINRLEYTSHLRIWDLKAGKRVKNLFNNKEKLGFSKCLPWGNRWIFMDKLGHSVFILDNDNKGSQPIQLPHKGNCMEPLQVFGDTLFVNASNNIGEPHIERWSLARRGKPPSSIKDGSYCQVHVIGPKSLLFVSYMGNERYGLNKVVYSSPQEGNIKSCLTGKEMDNFFEKKRKERDSF